MREKIKKVLAYILRSWEDVPEPPHPRLRILPPFMLEILAYLAGLAILYWAISYLWSLI